jgi:hypothetical protein
MMLSWSWRMGSRVVMELRWSDLVCEHPLIERALGELQTSRVAFC